MDHLICYVVFGYRQSEHMGLLSPHSFWMMRAVGASAGPIALLMVSNGWHAHNALRRDGSIAVECRNGERIEALRYSLSANAFAWAGALWRRLCQGIRNGRQKRSGRAE